MSAERRAGARAGQLGAAVAAWGTPRWQRIGATALFLLTEALAWFIVLRVFATAVERAGYTGLAASLDLAVLRGAPIDRPAALEAAERLREAASGVSAGPPWWIVVAGTGAAFLLAHYVTRIGLPSGLAAVVGVLASLLGVNALVHVAIAGDLQVWSGGTISQFPFEGAPGAEAYLADPSPDRAAGSARTTVVIGMVMLWLRFLWVGRSPVTFEKVIWSFTTGFLAVLIAALVATGRGSAGPGLLAVLYFVSGMLTLAVSNVARATAETRGMERTVPWAASVAVTVALLGITGLVFGILTILNVERLVSPLGDLLPRLISWILVLILTPVFWLLGVLLSPLAGLLDGIDTRFEEVFQGIARAFFVDPETRDALSDNEPPRWLRDGARLLAATAILAGLYFGGRLLFRRLRRPRGADVVYDELRSTSEGAGAGLGSLLRSILPRNRGGEEPAGWLRRQAVYRLYARFAAAARERGFPRRSGETPLEYADAASRVFAAPHFLDVASLFDGARYGRHYPEAVRVTELDDELERWEEATPATDELRSRVGRRGLATPELDPRVRESEIAPSFEEPALPETTDFPERI